MGIFSRRKNDNPYSGLRQQVFDIKQTQEIAEAMEGHPVFAAIVDMDMEDVIVSLACVADGTTSLYFSDGGGQLGLGQADENIRMATVAFLRSAEQVLEKMEKTEEYPLPRDGRHIVYLKTSDGVYKQEFNMKTVDEESRELQFLNLLYQNVLEKIGEYNCCAE